MKILIVEDYPLIQDGLRSLACEAFPGARVEGAGSLAEAVEKARGEEPQSLVLLDLDLPDCEGIETLKRFRRAHASPRVVVFAEFDDPADAFTSLQAGARGVVSRSYTRPVLSATLQLIAAGGIYMPPLPIGGSRPRLARPDTDLTRRQIDVVRLIVKGFRNKQIAERLKIAEETVKRHASAAYGILGVSSRSQVARAVARRGIQID